MSVSNLTNRRQYSLFAAIGFFNLLIALPASAQEQSQPTDNPPMEEIVVTGSHIARTDLETTVPVVSLSTAQIQASGITNLAQSLNQLSQFGVPTPGISNASSNFSDDTAGINTVALRNLGEQRTLVLIDGRRSVSGVPIGQGPAGVDIGTIPTYLIDHVDIVTGGGSAANGSEAVAGVVNIVLRDHYEGVMVNQQYGLTTDYADDKTETFDLLAGTSFAEEKGHVLFGLDFRDEGAVLSKDRPISAIDQGVGSALPNHYQPSSYNPNGYFGTDNGNYVTLPNGGIAPYSAATYGFDRNPTRTILIPTDKIALYGKSSYDITPDVTFFVDGRFSRTESTSQLEPIAIGAGTTTIGFSGQTLELPLTNAYIPAALAAKGLAGQDDGNGGFSTWRARFTELGDRGSTADRTNFGIVAGFKGEIFDRFKWETTYNYSEMDSYQQGQSGNVVKLQQELNTAVINGQIVCADPAARAAGCVPINIFGGGGNASAAAINYIKTLKTYTDQNRETDVIANIGGPVYTLPFGDIRLAAGFEYRREDGYDQPDQYTASGTGLDSQQPASRGGYDVRDYYIEGLVPVLKDLPFAKNLSIEGSFRYSDYSNLGGKQSYRYGLSYAPVQDIQFRAINSVAIRAPDLSDLYQGRGQSSIQVTDPCSGAGIASAANRALRAANCAKFPGVVPGFTENPAIQEAEISYQSGNTALTNERAQVLTYGVVLQPRWFKGFSMSVDFFKYKIGNAIQAIDLQTASNQCADTLASNFCGLVRRDTNPASATYGLILGVDQKVINVGSLDERGIDVAISDGVTINDIAVALTGDSWGDGRLDATWNYTFTQQLEYTTVNGVTTNQRGLFGAPHNKWTFHLLYSNDALEVNYGLRYIGSQSFDGGNGGPTVSPYIYNDVSIRYHVNDMITPYIGVNNIQGVRPPLVYQDYQQIGAGITYGSPGTNTVTDVYDAIGRSVYAGVNFKMGFGGDAPAETAAYVPPPVVAPKPASTARSYQVFFDFNKSDLTPQAVTIVDTAAKNAGPAKVTEIEVTGHTDTVGSDAYNMRLSRRRAESVAAELEKMGIPSSEIAIFAKGKKDLLVPTADGVKEPQNRRVQIVYAGGAAS
jgi:outer membrane protein OmpA-like peptidoglycan-associated protein